MKLLATWEMDVFPPTTNHMQRTDYRSNIRYDTKEYQQFKRNTQALMTYQGIPNLMPYADSPLSLVVSFHWSEWFTKAGEIRKNRDVSNRYKAIEDAIFRFIGIDDSRNIVPIPVKALPEGSRDKYITAQLYLIDSPISQFTFQHQFVGRKGSVRSENLQ